MSIPTTRRLRNAMDFVRQQREQAVSRVEELRAKNPQGSEEEIAELEATIAHFDFILSNELPASDMPQEWVLWGAALHAERVYGEGASEFVQQRVEGLEQARDIAGVQTWRRIASLLGRLSPDSGDPCG